MDDDDWQVVERTGWISVPGFGQINPRRDSESEAGVREYFTAKTESGEFAKATGESISGGPETWYYQPDSPFLLTGTTGPCIEVEISVLAGGRYAVRYRPGVWPGGETGGW
ncbi:hypothetical protein [Mycobacteroides chelonae]|uniref:hypothetical protein n=1 Tax=Mycobacteroides chelonae TaxID=1774 RepID=UPI0008A910A7|nr:hypothetical protein [Mycobacteroides chelonae]OHT54590.1 hypothetical protein BKG63_07465 [Mycobacteroides chelonae]OHU00613.1 hypothetical protein BKG72_05780 [Mycobacteroides chelonae]OLT87117.1 hypothetical protein BKG59_22445 [Mycobacteroides chelonae]